MKKNILIIGGSGGIGSETAKKLSYAGMNVSATYFSKKISSIEDGQDLSYYKIDLLDNVSVKNCIQEVIKKVEKIDSIVYSVSLEITNKNVLGLEWIDFQKHIDIQVRGLMNVIFSLKEYIKKKNKFKIIVVLTEYCLGKPPSSTAHYITAKYALMGLSKSLSVDLAKYNCTVNMISPGMVNTNLLKNLPHKLVEIVADENPQKKIAEPSDVASVVEFLVGDGSDYLNGVNIPVNGGGVMY